jgi:DNA-binding IclR family transcriptional regulator
MTEPAVDPTGRSFTRVRVLGKVRDILDLFTLDQPTLDLRQMREATGLPVSTLNRLVRNMVNDGLLQQRGSEFHIGIAMLRWGAIACRGLNTLDIVTPHLEALRDNTNETAAYYVRDGKYRVCVALAESRQPIGRRLSLGHVLPAHVGSPGKVLMAFDPGATVELDLDHLEALTDRTITSPDRLLAELERIRAQGFAKSDGEWASDVGGVAAPVFGPDNALQGAIAISGPSSRMTKSTLAKWTKCVRETAQEVTAQLGGVGFSSFPEAK